jgi:predicted phage tail protein
MLNYTKEYISGAEFRKQYEDMRKNAKPQEPVLKPLRSIPEIQKDEISKTEKSIRDAEKTIREVNADMAKAMQPVLDMLRKNLKDFQNPDHEYFSSIAMGEKYQQEGQLKNYKDDMKKWETDFPENINAFIGDKLKKMLEYTKGIDYNAALIDKYGKKRFVNPAYEGKRTEWKQGFRAGKEVTEQARAFGENWLTHLK